MNFYSTPSMLFLVGEVSISSRREAALHDLTGFQRDILYTVAGEEGPHGLGIKSGLEDYYESEINHGRLYPNPDDLVEKGLLEKSQLDRRTNQYTITQRGVRELKARREWEKNHLGEAISSDELEAAELEDAPTA